MEKIIFSNESERIDTYLASILSYSRSQIQKMIKEEKVLVNGKTIKQNYILSFSDEIEYEPLEIKEIDLKPQDLHIEIIYEDEYLAVVYKPKGMVVHPASGNIDKTLVNGLLYSLSNLSTINGVIRPGIVHRIDKDTTGLLLVAKCDEAHIKLSEDLKVKNVKRVYYAICHGVIAEDDGIINAPIGRSKTDRKKMDVVSGGKEAITTFHVIERFMDKTFVECVLKTGRTHQIRVHFKYIGHPILGDPLYCNRKEGVEFGQFLHAGVIGFNHPITNKYLEFSYPLPEYFQAKLEELRNV